MSEQLNTDYKHLYRSGVNAWVSSLKENKGSDKQIELLKVVFENDCNKFPEYIETCIETATEKPIAYERGNTVPKLINADGSCPINLCAGHMYLMPAKDIIKLYNHLKDISIQDATSAMFWGALTLSEIKDKRIKPVWLSVSRNDDEAKALSNLEKVIHSNDARKIDRYVRRIIRWLMAPGLFRYDAAELYGNCSLAKSWWCGYLANACTEELQETDMIRMTESLQGIWLELADYISGALTVIAEIPIATGLALWVEAWKKEHNETKMTRITTRSAIHNLGSFTTVRMLGLDSPVEVQKILSKLTHIPEEVHSS